MLPYLPDRTVGYILFDTGDQALGNLGDGHPWSVTAQAAVPLDAILRGPAQQRGYLMAASRRGAIKRLYCAFYMAQRSHRLDPINVGIDVECRLAIGAIISCNCATSQQDVVFSFSRNRHPMSASTRFCFWDDSPAAKEQSSRHPPAD